MKLLPPQIFTQLKSMALIVLWAFLLFLQCQ